MPRRKTVAIIYNCYYPEGVYQQHEDEAAESIIEDVMRIEKILASTGYRVFCIAVHRSSIGFLRRLQKIKPGLVFNLCEGALGDSRHEMSVASLIELSGIPYTGCGPLTLGIALDKGLTKKLLLAEGIPTPLFFVSEGTALGHLPAGMHFPLFVKPLREDASLGIDGNAFVENTTDLKRRCYFITRQYRQPALVEEYIEGREINVSILGNGRVQVLPISEIDMSRVPSDKPRVCDYRAKWITRSEEYVNTVPLCPARLPKTVAKRVREIAVACYRLLSCRGYARVDFRLSSGGIPYVLEVNPNPCIGLDSGIVRSAHAAGMSYEELICRIAELGMGLAPG